VTPEDADELEGLEIKHLDVRALEPAKKQSVLNIKSQDRVVTHF